MNFHLNDQAHKIATKKQFTFQNRPRGMKPFKQNNASRKMSSPAALMATKQDVLDSN